jgi:hypothetical protein
MISRGWFYVAYMAFFVGVIYLVEWYLGQLYARYVLAYTGTVFIAGMLLGQKSERAWNKQPEDDPRGIYPGAGENREGRRVS